MDKHEEKRILLALKEKDKEINDLRQQIASVCDVMINIKPMLGLLIAGMVVIEKKGLITDGEVAQVSEEDHSSFVKKSFTRAGEEMRGGPDETGTVENNRGNKRTGVFRGESVGEHIQSPSIDEQPGG